MFVKIRKRFKKSQASLEYAALIGVVVGAIIIMSTYMRRSVEGKIRKESDDVGDNYDLNTGNYNYTQTLQDPETTYTAFGSNGTEAASFGSLDGGGFLQGVNTGEGVQVQMTTDSGTRQTDETISTGN